MTKPPASEQRPSRRNCIGLMTRAELVIFDAAQEVEKAGADVRLTDAINLLHQAREKVGDFVDGIAPAPPEQPARGDGVRRVEFKSIFGAIAFLNGLPLPLLAGHGVRIVVEVEVLDDAPSAGVPWPKCEQVGCTMEGLHSHHILGPVADDTGRKEREK